jgi:hypothetical protein
MSSNFFKSTYYQCFPGNEFFADAPEMDSYKILKNHGNADKY